jgi:Protein of unknown function (DUF3307)
MTADPVLVLAWLVLAHLVADFVLQTGTIVAAKNSSGRLAWRGLFAHGAGVALALIPLGLAFGIAGVWVLVFVTVTHVLVDRLKVLATRRAEARALAAAHRLHEGRAPAAGLGRAWTPLPAAYFALDQIAHLAILGVAWLVWLAGRAPTADWVTVVDRVAGGWDRAVAHDVTLAVVVLVSLVIANVRAGALFVATLVRPLEAGAELAGPEAAARHAGTATAAPAAATTAATASARGSSRPPAAVPATSPAAERPRGWSFRIGPFAGRATIDPPPPGAETAVVIGEQVSLPTPAQVGATIGIIERLLIVMFVLVGADAAIGFVVGAKTIARFKQLDDRDFAEYYLLGTLASVSIAIVTAVVARAALAA